MRVWREPRFHSFTDDGLVRYALMADRSALRCWHAYKYTWLSPRQREQMRVIGLYWRSEYWAVVSELAFRYNPILDRDFLRTIIYEEQA